MNSGTASSVRIGNGRKFSHKALSRRKKSSRAAQCTDSSSSEPSSETDDATDVANSSALLRFRSGRRSAGGPLTLVDGKIARTRSDVVPPLHRRFGHLSRQPPADVRPPVVFSEERDVAVKCFIRFRPLANHEIRSFGFEALAADAGGRAVEAFVPDVPRGAISPLIQRQLEVLRKYARAPLAVSGKVLSPDADNATVYDAVVQPAVLAALSGCRTAIFVLGDNGAGRSFTAFGNASFPGVAVQALTDLFAAAASYLSLEDSSNTSARAMPPGDVVFAIRLAVICHVDGRLVDAVAALRAGSTDKLPPATLELERTVEPGYVEAFHCPNLVDVPVLSSDEAVAMLCAALTTCPPEADLIVRVKVERVILAPDLSLVERTEGEVAFAVAGRWSGGLNAAESGGSQWLDALRSRKIARTPAPAVALLLPYFERRATPVVLACASPANWACEATLGLLSRVAAVSQLRTDIESVHTRWSAHSFFLDQVHHVVDQDKVERPIPFISGNVAAHHVVSRLTVPAGTQKWSAMCHRRLLQALSLMHAAKENQVPDGETTFNAVWGRFVNQSANRVATSDTPLSEDEGFESFRKRPLLPHLRRFKTPDQVHDLARFTLDSKNRELKEHATLGSGHVPGSARDGGSGPTQLSDSHAFSVRRHNASTAARGGPGSAPGGLNAGDADLVRGAGDLVPYAADLVESALGSKKNPRDPPHDPNEFLTGASRRKALTARDPTQPDEELMKQLSLPDVPASVPRTWSLGAVDTNPLTRKLTLPEPLPPRQPSVLRPAAQPRSPKAGFPGHIVGKDSPPPRQDGLVAPPGETPTPPPASPHACNTDGAAGDGRRLNWEPDSPRQRPARAAASTAPSRKMLQRGNPIKHFLEQLIEKDLRREERRRARSSSSSESRSTSSGETSRPTSSKTSSDRTSSSSSRRRAKLRTRSRRRDRRREFQRRREKKKPPPAAKKKPAAKNSDDEGPQRAIDAAGCMNINQGTFPGGPGFIGSVPGSLASGPGLLAGFNNQMAGVSPMNQYGQMPGVGGYPVTGPGGLLPARAPMMPVKPTLEHHYAPAALQPFATFQYPTQEPAQQPIVVHMHTYNRRGRHPVGTVPDGAGEEATGAAAEAAKIAVATAKAAAAQPPTPPAPPAPATPPDVPPPVAFDQPTATPNGWLRPADAALANSTITVGFQGAVNMDPRLFPGARGRRDRGGSRHHRSNGLSNDRSNSRRRRRSGDRAASLLKAERHRLAAKILQQLYYYPDAAVGVVDRNVQAALPLLQPHEREKLLAAIADYRVSQGLSPPAGGGVVGGRGSGPGPALSHLSSDSTSSLESQSTDELIAEIRERDLVTRKHLRSVLRGEAGTASDRRAVLRAKEHAAALRKMDTGELLATVSSDYGQDVAASPFGVGASRPDRAAIGDGRGKERRSSRGSRSGRIGGSAAGSGAGTQSPETRSSPGHSVAAASSSSSSEEYDLINESRRARASLDRQTQALRADTPKITFNFVPAPAPPGPDPLQDPPAPALGKRRQTLDPASASLYRPRRPSQDFQPAPNVNAAPRPRDSRADSLDSRSNRSLDSRSNRSLESDEGLRTCTDASLTYTQSTDDGRLGSAEDTVTCGSAAEGASGGRLASSRSAAREADYATLPPETAAGSAGSAGSSGLSLDKRRNTALPSLEFKADALHGASSPEKAAERPMQVTVEAQARIDRSAAAALSEQLARAAKADGDGPGPAGSGPGPGGGGPGPAGAGAPVTGWAPAPLLVEPAKYHADVYLPDGVVVEKKSQPAYVPATFLPPPARQIFAPDAGSPLPLSSLLWGGAEGPGRGACEGRTGPVFERVDEAGSLRRRWKSDPRLRWEMPAANWEQQGLLAGLEDDAPAVAEWKSQLRPYLDRHWRARVRDGFAEMAEKMAAQAADAPAADAPLLPPSLERSSQVARLLAAYGQTLDLFARDEPETLRAGSGELSLVESSLREDPVASHSLARFGLESTVTEEE